MRLSTVTLLAGILLTGVVVSGQALAAKVFATTHLNIRTGPGEQFPVAGEMCWNSHGEIDGCAPDYSWCQISTNNGIGWTAGHCLIENSSKRTETIEQFGAQSGIPVIVLETVAAVRSVERTPTGGALVEAITSAAELVEYVLARPVAPVHVAGEIVVGAAIPTELLLYEVPSSPYQYAVVNGVTVLVEPTVRKVI
ncbi:MAG: DUF1236 domain-containing protein [Roseibium sp.]|uniref:DUF1236 domain-containing protein n=1 Tax=Roseibium sp. TaxID=1936156 RepID=UPI003D9C5FD2